MMRIVSLFLQPWEGDVSPNDGIHIPSCQLYLSGCFPCDHQGQRRDRWTGSPTVDRLQEEFRSRPSCLPTCSAQRPAGLVLGGCGRKTRSRPLFPSSSFLSSPLSFKWLPALWHNQIGNLRLQSSPPPGLPCCSPTGAKVTL